MRMKKRDRLKSKEFVIELGSEGFFGNSDNGKETKNKTQEKLLGDESMQALIQSQKSLDIQDIESVDEKVDF